MFPFLQISIRTGNLILAILTDILLGYLALELLTTDKKELGALLMGILEVSKSIPSITEYNK